MSRKRSRVPLLTGPAEGGHLGARVAKGSEHARPSSLSRDGCGASQPPPGGHLAGWAKERQCQGVARSGAGSGVATIATPELLYPGIVHPKSTRPSRRPRTRHETEKGTPIPGIAVRSHPPRVPRARPRHSGDSTVLLLGSVRWLV
jgi:hypothetical protein